MLGKIFTKILNWGLTNYVRRENIIVEEQAGFRAGYATVDNVFVIESILSERLSRPRQKLYVCFIDFRKAFDSVPRQAVWEKLFDYGIRGKFLAVLMSIYMGCTFMVKTGISTLSDPDS